MQQFFPFALHQSSNWNSCPTADDSCNFFFRDLIPQQIVALFLGSFCLCLFGFEFLFQGWQLAVFQFGCFVQVVFPFCLCNLGVDAFQLFPQLLHFRDVCLFVLPLCFHCMELFPHLSQFLLHFLQMCLRKLVVFFFQGSFFDFVLHDFPLDFIHFGRHRVHLCPNQCTRFINQVNCLIRQEPVGDIPVGERCGCNQSLVLNFHAMEHFIPFFQTTQNRNGIFDRRFIDHNWLESPFQCRIFFNILPIFVQGGCTDTMQFTSCQHRLQEVAGIHCTICFTCSDNRMQFINEQNDFAFTLLDFVQNGFQPLFKFTTIFCTGNQCTQIQREQDSVFQVIRNVAPYNSQCQPFGNRCFTNTRFANQHRIVLGLSGQDSNDVSDFTISANDWV